ncbi:hypothetical protein C0Q70_03447 [Pomacea canaliculata]|uniref:Uncharacterized protein n=1 Tax=Pomacea canaliculata TaxID=400727 RepID=A0A2T7PSQ1_POMCA|nr:hypothetical protein C0Q70_03447 [Pomacea canaliculata]
MHFDLQRLQEASVAEIFMATAGGKFFALNLMECDVNTLSGNIKEVLLSTAQEVQGRQRKTKQQWVTNDILALCAERRVLEREMKSKLEAVTKYKEVNCAIKKGMKTVWENWIERQCRDIEDVMARGDSKKAYQLLKTHTKTDQYKTSVIEHKKSQKS